MKYIVYITTNTINTKIYVGVHKVEDPNVFDGYIGCGIKSDKQKLNDNLFHKAVKKHGYHNFTRHTLAVFNTAEEAYHLERQIVTQAFVQSRFTYNCIKGGICNAGTKNKCSIIQYTMSGKFVREWSSITEASESVNCSPGTLRQALSPPYKSRAGYQWRYKTEDYPLYIGYYNSKLRVAQYDKDGNFIKLWSSCKAAAANFGKKSDSALLSYAKSHKLYEDYQWRIIRNHEEVPDFIEEYKDKNIILQMTLDNQVVREWDKRILYKDSVFKNVKDCVNGRCKTYKGFKWKYKYKL
jgi:hypothetical protein